MWCSYLKATIFDNLLGIRRDDAPDRIPAGAQGGSLVGKLLPLSVVPSQRRITIDPTA
jgi:hypothetical protein